MCYSPYVPLCGDVQWLMNLNIASLVTKLVLGYYMYIIMSKNIFQKAHYFNKYLTNYFKMGNIVTFLKFGYQYLKLRNI